MNFKYFASKIHGFISHKFQTVFDCISQIPNSNLETVLMSVCVITFMIFMNEILKVSKIMAKNAVAWILIFLIYLATMFKVMQISGARRIDCCRWWYIDIELYAFGHRTQCPFSW